MANKKIVCLGAASMNFAGMYQNIVNSRGLHGCGIHLYDIDFERSEMMARYIRRISDMAGADVKVVVERNLAKAVEGADFAIFDIGGIGGGGGGFHKRGGIHMNDILTCARYGIYQIVGDTCGPAAMMAAFRSIPIYLNICREMEKRCPHVKVLSHANPMAILCRAMNKYTQLAPVIGICHGVQGGILYLAEVLKVHPSDLDVTWIGTNHYYWFTEIYHKGKDIYPKVRETMKRRTPPEQYVLHARLTNIFGYQIVYPDDSHIVEFYPYLAQMKDGSRLPYAMGKSHHGHEVTALYAEEGLSGKRKSRSREKPLTRAVILKQFSDFLDICIKGFEEQLNKGAWQPDPNEEEGKDVVVSVEEKMAFVESVGSMIEAMACNTRRIHIVNIPNRGVVPNLPDTAILETEGMVTSHGVRGIYAGEAPVVLKGQLEKIAAWQELVTDAAVKGEKQLALQSLMLDPAAILPDRAEAMFNELLRNSKGCLPQFKM